MRVFYESTTAQLGLVILSIAGLASGFTDDLKWNDWLDAAIYVLGIYAGKEGIRYGSEAYKQSNGAP